MKRLIVLIISASMLLSACIPDFLQPVQTQVPQVTSPVENLITQPSVPTVTTDTPTPLVADSESTATLETGTAISITLESMSTSTVDPNTTPQSAASETATPTITDTPQSETSTSTPGGYPTVTPTDLMVTRQAGIIPPGTKYAQVKLINKSKRQTYVSLHWHYDDKTVAYFEYPVGGTVSDKIPVGRYTYVAWVGGRKMTGSFRMDSGIGVTITVYKDRIVIKN